MKPLGALRVGSQTAPRPMAEAGGRLFVDVTQGLASSASRASLLGVLEKSDPLIREALQTVLDRGDFIPSVPDQGPAWVPPGAGSAAIETNPAIVANLIARSEHPTPRAVDRALFSFRFFISRGFQFTAHNRHWN